MATDPRKRKFDVTLQDLDSYQLHQDAVKSGSAVQFNQQPDGSVVCTTTDSNATALGNVPLEHTKDLGTGNYVGSVRTIQRSQEEEKRIIGLIVRCQYAESQRLQVVDPFAVPKEAEEEDIQRLSNKQLNSLAVDDKVKWLLRDERLQTLLKDIDAAPNREQALTKALEGPNFKEFADYLLQVATQEGGQATTNSQLDLVDELQRM